MTMMKATCISFLWLVGSVTADSSHNNIVIEHDDPGNNNNNSNNKDNNNDYHKKKDIFNGAATRKTPIIFNAGYDGYGIPVGEFISLAETSTSGSVRVTVDQDQRHLQQTGSGFGNDPTACSATGTQFTCVAPSAFVEGNGENANVTQVQNTITCTLDDDIGMDFQRSEGCVCNAQLTGHLGDVRQCACSVCERGSTQSVALDCSMVPEDPFVTGPCVSLSCDGRCNGTGAAVVNQPTPAPNTGEDEEDEEDAGPLTSLSFIIAVFGAFVSFVSVYMV